MSARWMIYGANGYTGKLIAELAASQLESPILAGRKKATIRPLAEKYGFGHRIFSLDDPRAVTEGLTDVSLVLNCAGPFSQTASPFFKACLEKRVHYLDITGEIEVFENAHRLSEKAESAGCIFMPGVGFDVVPTDCMARFLAESLENPTELELAFTGSKTVSPGTLKTMVKNIPAGGWIRRNGRLISVKPAYLSQKVQFPCGERLVTTIPWGDVSTAYYTTGIPNIMAFTEVPLMMRRFAPLVTLMGKVLQQKTLSKKVSKWIEKRVTGPDQYHRENGKMYVWGKVKNFKGRTVEANLTTPEGYQFTALSAFEAVKRVLKDPLKPGTYTPARAFGKDFVTSIAGVSNFEILTRN